MIQFTINKDIIPAEGPYTSTDKLRHSAGVYTILGRNKQFGPWTVLDVGESEDIKNRVSIHDRGEQWVNQGYKELSVAPIYVSGPRPNRLKVEAALREAYRPPCGDR